MSYISKNLTIVYNKLLPELDPSDRREHGQEWLEHYYGFIIDNYFTSSSDVEHRPDIQSIIRKELEAKDVKKVCPSSSVDRAFACGA